MAIVKDVLIGVRTLLEDPDGSGYADDDFLMPKLQIAYDKALIAISMYSTPCDTQYRYLLSVPPGVTDLSTYQVQPPPRAASTSNYPLAGLITPLDIDWKQAGTPEGNYTPACEKQKMPSISPGRYAPGQQTYWEWRSNHLYITPMQFTIDIRVRGEFPPPPLTLEGQTVEIHSMLGHYLKYETAALSGLAMLNEMQMTAFESEAKMALDGIISFFIRKDQSLNVRIGKMSGRRRRGWGIGY